MTDRDDPTVTGPHPGLTPEGSFRLTAPDMIDRDLDVAEVYCHTCGSGFYVNIATDATSVTVPNHPMTP